MAVFNYVLTRHIGYPLSRGFMSWHHYLFATFVSTLCFTDLFFQTQNKPVSDTMDTCLALSSLNLHCHLHPLQAANCCRNSRLLVDEDDL